MAKYRKKPVVVEAFQWRDDKTQIYPQWLLNAYDKKKITSFFEGGEPVLAIKTLEGTMIARKGDYIIKGVRSEFYPCKPDIFEQTYEQV